MVLTTSFAALAMVAMALTATGCGSSSASSTALTKAQLIAKADAICARFWREYHAHGTTDAKELTTKIHLIAGYELKEAKELRKLTPPAGMAFDWKRILAGHQAMANDSVMAERYFKRGVLQAMQRLVNKAAHVQETVLLTARRNGFKDCARAA